MKPIQTNRIQKETEEKRRGPCYAEISSKMMMAMDVKVKGSLSVVVLLHPTAEQK